LKEKKKTKIIPMMHDTIVRSIVFQSCTEVPILRTQ